jgi:hypothetical protein
MLMQRKDQRIIPRAVATLNPTTKCTSFKHQVRTCGGPLFVPFASDEK